METTFLYLLLQLTSAFYTYLVVLLIELDKPGEETNNMLYCRISWDSVNKSEEKTTKPLSHQI